tara:strand:- start:103 stop:261 length:159 start_codon:yes stop_codon:yes gene_type:complete
MKRIFRRIIFRLQVILSIFFKNKDELETHDFIYEIEEKDGKHRSEKEKQNDN